MNKVLSYINPNTGQSLFNTTVNTWSVDYIKVTHGMSNDQVIAFCEALRNCKVEVNYRVLQHSTELLPVITDNTIAGLMSAAVYIGITS